MKVPRCSYLLVGGVLLLLTFVPVSTAVADKPQVETFPFEFTDVVDCGDFLAIDEFVGVDKVTTFFDNEGNPVGLQIHETVRGTLTNSETGTSLSDRADFTIFMDFEEGTATGVGSFFRITRPGEGIVVANIGRLAFDGEGNVIFSAGLLQFLLEGETLFCEALD